MPGPGINPGEGACLLACIQFQKEIPMTETLQIEGYASLFDVQDLGGDIVRPGAFAASLLRKGTVPMLFQHEAGEPAGVWDEMFEDRRGLFVRGRLYPDGPRGRIAQRLLARGALDGLSIGFRTIKAADMPRGRALHDIDLWEVSLVTFPMLPQARLRVISPAARAA
jgi:HK97 family phage prohead protease